MAKDLKNTLVIPDATGTPEEYNINAKYSDEAGRVTTHLTIKESDTIVGYFDGDSGKTLAKTEINYVPSTGGIFSGIVEVSDQDLTTVPETAILNARQTEVKFAHLAQGNPLFLWQQYKDAYGNASDFRTLSQAKGVSGTIEKLNTVLGNEADFKEFEALFNAGSTGLRYSLTADGKNYKVTGTYDSYSTDVEVPYVYDGRIVNEIAESAFKGKTITSVKIPDSVLRIGKEAFSGCALSSIELPPSVKEIGDSAFASCSNLNNFFIPAGITTIGSRAFSGCNSLTTLIVSSSTNIGALTIGNDAFPSTLNTVKYKGEPGRWSTLQSKLVTGGAPSGISRILSYDYAEKPLTGVADYAAEPILYICNDSLEGDNNYPLSSNAMYLKPSGKFHFLEISKGATRLNSTTEVQTLNYYSYETLAAIIAGINTRLDALGGNTLTLPNTLKVTESETLTVVPSNDSVIDSDVLLSSDIIAAIPTVQDLEAAIVKIIGDAKYATAASIIDATNGYGDSLAGLRGDFEEFKTGVEYELNDGAAGEAIDYANSRIDNIENSMYRSYSNGALNNKTAHKIDIVTSLPKSTDYNDGDIVIVLAE